MLVYQRVNISIWEISRGPYCHIVVREVDEGYIIYPAKYTGWETTARFCKLFVEDLTFPEICGEIAE